MLAMLERIRLLIIDDWGPEPLTAEQRRDLLEIVLRQADAGWRVRALRGEPFVTPRAWVA